MSMLKGVAKKKDFGFLVEFPRKSLYFLFGPLHISFTRVVRKCPRCSSPPCPPSFERKLNWVGGEREGYYSVRNMA